MVLLDELWQARHGNISSRFWQSISDGGGGLCRGVYLYNLICYLLGQLLRQSLKQSLHESRPHCKSFDCFSILIIVRQTFTKVHLCRAATLLAVQSEWIHHSSAYQSSCSTKIHFLPPLQCLCIRALTMRPRLQLFSGWRASRAPVNHRLLYLGHSKSSCVMACYLSSNNRSLSNPDFSLHSPGLSLFTPFSKSRLCYFSFLVKSIRMIGYFHPKCMNLKNKSDSIALVCISVYI